MSGTKVRHGTPLLSFPGRKTGWYTKTGLVFGFSENQILVAVIAGQKAPRILLGQIWFWIFRKLFEMSIKKLAGFLGADKFKSFLQIQFHILWLICLLRRKVLFFLLGHFSGMREILEWKRDFWPDCMPPQHNHV